MLSSISTVYTMLPCFEKRKIAITEPGFLPEAAGRCSGWHEFPEAGARPVLAAV